MDKDINDLLHFDIHSLYRNMCPCCTFELPDEEQMTYRMLVSIDGNESLKRNQMQRRVVDRSGKQTGVINIERQDNRRQKSVLFVEAEAVDEFKDEVKQSRKVS